MRKALLGAAYRGPQQEVGEKFGLECLARQGMVYWSSQQVGLFRQAAVNGGSSVTKIDSMAVPATSKVTAVIVNYCTPELTCRCVESFHRYYPATDLTIVDNGSDDETVRRLQAFTGTTIQLLRNPVNRGHGPAMDQAIRAATTELVLILDSDVEILRGGLIEHMRTVFGASDVLAAGRLVSMNRYGYLASPTARLVIPYVNPATMMLNRSLYLELPAFRHHGSPCLHTMRAAMERGLRVADVAVDAFVHHDGRGTCGRFGYCLGVMTSIDKILSRLRLFE